MFLHAALVYFPWGMKLKMLLVRRKKQWREKLFPADLLGIFWKGSIAQS